jgi:excisionase family DNA binding protein
MTPAKHHAHTHNLLATRDVAELLCMSREQVWRLWSTGRLPGYRFDHRLRFSRSDVEAFMASHYRAGASGSQAPPAKSGPRRRTTRARGASPYSRI